MSTVFITGGTGLTGANVCEQLIERGDAVRALVRNPEESAALAASGVKLVQGDITRADDVKRAGKGCDAAGCNRACEMAGMEHASRTSTTGPLRKRPSTPSDPRCTRSPRPPPRTSGRRERRTTRPTTRSATTR